VKHLGIVVLGLVLVMAGTAGAGTWDWQTLYEHHQIVTDGNPWPDVFSIRGLALAQDGTASVYFSHIQPASDGVTSPDMTDGYYGIGRLNVSGSLTGWVSTGTAVDDDQAKSLATDDRGYVYAGMGAGGAVRVFDANLSLLGTVTVANTTQIGGVAVKKSGSQYSLYVSDRNTGLVSCIDITNIASPTPVGTYTLAGTDLRGVAVDSAGAVWVADKKDGKVYKINSALNGDTSVDVPHAMDVALLGGFAYVSEQNGADSAIELLNTSDMTLADTLSSSLYGDSGYGLAGIDVSPAGTMFVASEDDFPNYDAQDFRDRIYDVVAGQSQTPEPCTMLLLGTGVVGVFGYIRRQPKK
jgi:hypothetical protein